MIIKKKPIYHIGDKRQEIKFAWLPITLSNGDVIWLAWYEVNQEYTMYGWITHEKNEYISDEY